MIPPLDDQGNLADTAEEVFAQLLADWDEIHCTGKSTAAAALETTPLTGELSDRLTKAKDCLKLLKQLWPQTGGKNEADRRSGRAYARFGRYEIQRELGRGGHGVVFLAIDPALKRHVALKVPRPEVLSSEELSRRFLREAEAAARLDHPSILSVYEVGTDGPICFTAAAYCDGGTLQEWLAREPSPLDPREAAEIILELAVAVHHAHTRGVLHRDLKPSNVLLVGRHQDASDPGNPRESNGSPLSAASPARRGNRLLDEWIIKIADFGLAKVADAQHDTTMNGVVMGTVNYMAPEQAAGRPEDIGIAADVYSLGVMLYELLTGAPPFVATTQLGAMQRAQRDEAAWPSKLRARIPADLRTICLTCLEKDPAERYPSAAALAADLQRFLHGEPVAARPLSLPERARRIARRHPALIALSAMAVCMAIGFLVELVWHNRRLAVMNAGLARSIEEGERQAELAQQSLAMARQQLDENRRRNLASDLRLAQHFAEAGNLRQFTGAMHETIGPRGSSDLHEFAWRYWWHRCRRGEYFVLPGHSRHVSDATFSADGKWIATGSADLSVRVWDCETGRELARLYGLQQEVLHVAFSPDGKLLAAGDAQGGLRVWSTDTWQLHRVLAPHGGPVRGLVFGGNDILITAAEDDRARVWNLSTGSVTDDREFTNRREITSLSASIPRNELLVGFKSGEIQVRSLDTINNKTGNLPGHHYEICGLTTSLQGDRAFSCDEKGNLRLWKLGDRLTIYKSPDNAYPQSKTAISPDGAHLAVIAHGNRLQVLSAADGAVKHERALEIESVSALEFSPDGRAILVAGEAGHVALWQPFERPHPQVAGHEKEAWCVAFAKDGYSFFTGSDDQTVRHWETATGRLLRTVIVKQPGTVASLALSPDQSLLVTTSLEEVEDLPDNVRLWNLADGKLVRGLKAHVSKVYSCALHPQGRYLASGGKKVVVWDLDSDGSYRTLNDSLKTEKKVKSIAFSPDGLLLAFSSENGHAYVYDFPSLTLKYALASGSEAWCVAFSPDGKKLATGNSDGEVIICDAHSGHIELALKGHLGGVRSVAYAHGGRTIATGSDDLTIKLWEPLTGQEFCSLAGHRDGIYAVTFSPDDQWLASCSHDGAVKLWPAPNVSESTLASIQALEKRP